jgi:hypothetical protein
MIEAALVNVGLGLLVLGLRLRMVGYVLESAGPNPSPPAHELILRGIRIVIVGLLVAILGVLM